MGYEVLLIKAAQEDYDDLDGAIKKQAKTQLMSKCSLRPALSFLAKSLELQ